MSTSDKRGCRITAGGPSLDRRRCQRERRQIWTALVHDDRFCQQFLCVLGQLREVSKASIGTDTMMEQESWSILFTSMATSLMCTARKRAVKTLPTWLSKK